MLGTDRPPRVGVYPRRYTDRDGMGCLNALVTSVYTLSESLQSTTSDLAPFRTQETRKQGGTTWPQVNVNVTCRLIHSLPPSISIDCVKRNQKLNRRERAEERTLTARPYQTARIRSSFFALGRVPSRFLPILLRVGMSCVCVSRRRKEGAFDTVCVNVDVDVTRLVGEVGKWHLADFGFWT